MATICGVDPKTIRDWGQESPQLGGGLKVNKMTELLLEQGFEGEGLYIKIDFKGQEVNAYIDPVCMAFMEYYAFEAGRYCTEEAKINYRALARKTLKDFIYRTVGYDPQDIIPISWRHYHDRLVINPVPLGYFSVCTKESDLVANREWFLEFTKQMHKLRCVSTGGVLKEYLSTLEREPEDLIGKDDEDEVGEDDLHLYFKWRYREKKYRLWDK